ncbi:hypothetical protein SSBR45G_74050 [Bradyrhizobium sp. SSBR45G]|uniref:hypothetical protein n=1 Tax=unclassified Bradyrhizobium TaxID=2631580 RepID=UPI0023429341|nr:MULTISPECIES: hypothetical protein [unclassified Bradyrhizobium]GLH82496.1 hypothetical protein SSBR45G_74050 [Bradyrhizobium sp. SSBR45G]GLH89916.1 hypothetical protein SSBR45R_73770 [Bradyrhizobium sp. SSBR45R]
MARRSWTGWASRLILVSFTLGGAAADAAERTMSWDSGCRFSIRFDPAKQDETRLRNTVHLLFGPSDFDSPGPTPAFEPKAVAALDPDKIERACKAALDVAARLEFIALPGVDDYRRARMAELKDSCDFELAQTRGFKTASALRDYQPAAACVRFVDAIEGKTDLQQVFRQTVEQGCANNASPKACVARYLAEAQKADGPERMRIYLVNFGWSNCAINYNLRNTGEKKMEQMRSALETQFRKMFKVKQDKCEEAD